MPRIVLRNPAQASSGSPTEPRGANCQAVLNPTARRLPEHLMRPGCSRRHHGGLRRPGGRKMRSTPRSPWNKSFPPGNSKPHAN